MRYSFSFPSASLSLVIFFAPRGSAENQTIQHLDGIQIEPQKVQPIKGLIRGKGYLDYGDLVFSSTATTPSTTTTTTIDVVVSTLPDYDNSVFDDDEPSFLETIGIGAWNSNGREYVVCCTELAVSAGLCETSGLGRILLSDPSEEKVRTTATIRPGNTTNDPMSVWRTSVRFDYTTHVVLVIANCNATTSSSSSNDATTLSVDGDLVWMSYISGSSILVGIVLAVLHSCLFLWYRYEMVRHKQTRIRVEKWLSGVLCLAAVAACLSLLYVLLETTCSEVEHLWLRVASDFFTKTTHVASRCLYVAVALGLGVTKPRLSLFATTCIAALGCAVLFTKEAADMMGDISFQRRDNDFGDDFNQHRHDFLKMQFKLNNLFLVWIPLALLRTMWSARNEAQPPLEPHKLVRYKWMWRLYLFSLLVTTGMVGMYLLSRYGPHKQHGYHGSPWTAFLYDKGLDRSNIDDICNFAFWITLACMAFLWKPNPEAPMYGYVLLSDNGDDPNNNSSHNNSNDDDEIMCKEGTSDDVGNNRTMELVEYPSSSEQTTASTSIDRENDMEQQEGRHDLYLHVETAEPKE